MRVAVGHLLLRTSRWGGEAVVELLVAVRKKMEKEMVASSYRGGVRRGAQGPGASSG
jgi:hypothetical protein